MDTNDVIESLAAKLAAADLTDAETDLLRTLIAEPDDDVAGYTTGWSPLLGTAASTKGWIGPGGTLSPQKAYDLGGGLSRGEQKFFTDIDVTF
jgi:hypothetical protein